METAVLPPSPALNSARKLGRVVMVRNVSAAGSAGRLLYTPSCMVDTPGQPWIGVAPVVRRSAAIWLGSAAIFMLLAVVWLVVRGPLGLPRGGFFRVLPLTLIVVPWVVFLPLWHWRVRCFRRALFASRFRLCTHCAYDLATLAPTGTCPECGHSYDAGRDVATWDQTGAPYAEPRPKGFVPWSPPTDHEPPRP
jgi:hypothetical protein